MKYGIQVCKKWVFKKIESNAEALAEEIIRNSRWNFVEVVGGMFEVCPNKLFISEK